MKVVIEDGLKYIQAKGLFCLYFKRNWPSGVMFTILILSVAVLNPCTPQSALTLGARGLSCAVSGRHRPASHEAGREKPLAPRAKCPQLGLTLAIL